MNLGIGPRLLLVHLVLSLIVLGAVEFTLAPAMRSELDRQLQGRLRTAAEALSSELAEDVPPQAAVQHLAKATGFRMSVVGGDGALLGDSAVPTGELQAAGNHAERPEIVDARRRQYGTAMRRSETTGITTRYVAVTATDDRVARAAADLRGLDAQMEAAHRAILLAAGIGLLVAFVLGAAASHVAGRSIRGLTRTARLMAEGDLHVEAPKAPGELGEVAVALERLAGQLASQFDRLTTERDLLDAVLAAMEEAVLVLRPDGRLLLANGTASHFLALPRSAQDHPLIETVRFPALLDAVKHASEGNAAPLELVLPGPPRRELLGRAAPLPKGSEAEVVVVLREVTELRRLEAMRRDFVASASHELRTPVAAIRGYAETLAGGAIHDPQAASRFLAGLSRQAERLSSLVDDLLDLSRIESGGMRLAPEPIAAADALRRLHELSRDRAERKGVQLVLEPVPEELRIRADPRAVDMVVGNLLDNAIKYTPAGGTVTFGAGRGEAGGVRIVVRDTGPGIEPQHQARIFERFYRVDAGRSRDVGGTGLGLAIAKHVAQQSGGDVGVESTPGVGSRFWVRLPAA